MNVQGFLVYFIVVVVVVVVVVLLFILFVGRRGVPRSLHTPTYMVACFGYLLGVYLVYQFYIILTNIE